MPEPYIPMAKNSSGSRGKTNPEIEPAYRALVLGKDGSLVGSVRLDSRNDEEACARAKALVDGHAIELWQGVRFIEHFPMGD
ncbi:MULTISPECIES: hypothetical protein [unclassified Methylobacterium]|uniref:hypothetical protein n=1 Tax=unclassified Methylobacterium TaxID=2615210 RepID=UPI000AC80C35|nr:MULTISPECIES: hypothetical protein [unclassified Methylobacterium]USU32687.1 hypothetical protein NG677_02975 [Methylobacterium sp. OTU13CASTA1]